MDTKTVSQHDYAVHPLANLFPEIAGDEYLKLKADIETHGQLEPIILDEAGEVLLDGRTRLRICKELGRTPRIDRFAATSVNSETDMIWSRNVMRRHLTDDQRAALSQRWADTIKDAAKDRQRQGPGVTNNALGESAKSIHTRKETAKKAGVSEHKIRQVETVAAHAPEILPAVERGEVSLKNAAATAAKKATKRTRTTRKPETEKRAAVWLSKVLTQFEQRGYATADLALIVSKLGASEKEILYTFSEWLHPARRSEHNEYTAIAPASAEVEARA